MHQTYNKIPYGSVKHNIVVVAISTMLYKVIAGFRNLIAEEFQVERAEIGI